MARQAAKHPTELELEILKILWEEGDAPVRDVRDALASKRDLAYTSVMTTMNIMVDKGYLKRKREGASYRYFPKISQQATTASLAGDLLTRAFDGSAASLMTSLIDANAIDEAELKTLRKMINAKMKEQSK